MNLFDLDTLKARADDNSRDANITKTQAQSMRDAAVFVCEDKDYFVVPVQDGYATIIGAELLGVDEFEINIVHGFESRDGAIACALAWSCSDAGGKESEDRRVLEMSDYCGAWS